MAKEKKTLECCLQDLQALCRVQTLLMEDRQTHLEILGDTESAPCHEDAKQWIQQGDLIIEHLKKMAQIRTYLFVDKQKENGWKP